MKSSSSKLVQGGDPLVATPFNTSAYSTKADVLPSHWKGPLLARSRYGANIHKAINALLENRLSGVLVVDEVGDLVKR